PVPLNMLADVQLALKQYTDAEASYLALRETQPSVAAAMGIHVARMQGGFGDPAEPLERWLRSHASDVPVRFALAEALKASDRRAEAQAEYERILAREPDNAVALNNLAWLYYQRSDKRAEATARKAYSLAP